MPDTSLRRAACTTAARSLLKFLLNEGARAKEEGGAPSRAVRQAHAADLRGKGAAGEQ